MPRLRSENVFLSIGFQSSSDVGNLKKIEIIGIPGQKYPNGECVISEKMKQFFDDLIARPLFRSSQLISDCDFSSLKIWLYSTDIKKVEQQYVIPDIDESDIEIRSIVPYSKLEVIYILDNGLKGVRYNNWRLKTQKLANPLFSEFIAPPEVEVPPIFGIRMSRFLEAIGENFFDQYAKLDQYAKMKHQLFFNALIIQID